MISLVSVVDLTGQRWFTSDSEWRELMRVRANDGLRGMLCGVGEGQEEGLAEECSSP